MRNKLGLGRVSSNVKVKNDLGYVMIVKQDEPGVIAERITVGLNTDHRWSIYVYRDSQRPCLES